MNHTSDPFTSHLVFLSFTSPTSNKFDYDSSHRNDYYSHPLSSLFDSDLKTEWWFKGNDAEISLSYSNPLYSFVSFIFNILEVNMLINIQLLLLDYMMIVILVVGNSMVLIIILTLSYLIREVMKSLRIVWKGEHSLLVICLVIIVISNFM